MGQSSPAASAHRQKQKEKPELTYVNEREEPKISLQPSEGEPAREPPVERAEESSLRAEYYVQLYTSKFEHEYVALPSAQLQLGDYGLEYICQRPWIIHTLSLGTSTLTQTPRGSPPEEQQRSQSPTGPTSKS